MMLGHMLCLLERTFERRLAIWEDQKPEVREDVVKGFVWESRFL
jgi:hypothetical protein